MRMLKRKVDTLEDQLSEKDAKVAELRRAANTSLLSSPSQSSFYSEPPYSPVSAAKVAALQATGTGLVEELRSVRSAHAAHVAELEAALRRASEGEAKAVQALVLLQRVSTAPSGVRQDILNRWQRMHDSRQRRSPRRSASPNAANNGTGVAPAPHVQTPLPISRHYRRETELLPSSSPSSSSSSSLSRMWK